MMHMVASIVGCSDENPVLVVEESDSKTLELQRRRWVPASPPVDPDGFGIRTLDGDKRDNIFWYNIEPNFGAHMQDLNPNLPERENILVRTLDVELDTVSTDSGVWV